MPMKVISISFKQLKVIQNVKVISNEEVIASEWNGSYNDITVAIKKMVLKQIFSMSNSTSLNVTQLVLFILGMVSVVFSKMKNTKPLWIFA